MRKEHYIRVVEEDRVRQYPLCYSKENKHSIERPSRTKRSRDWSRVGMGYRGEDRAGAWSAICIRTNKRPKWVTATRSIAQRRIIKGDLLGCRVNRSGEEAYVFIENRRTEGWIDTGEGPFVGRSDERLDDQGQLTFHRGKVNTRPGRKAYYEAYYRLSQDPKKGLYMTLQTTAKTKEEAYILRKSIRFPLLIKDNN